MICQGRDNKFALLPDQFSKLILESKIAKECMQDKGLDIQDCENDVANIMRGDGLKMNEENEVDLIVRFKDEEFWLRYLTKALSVQKNTLINLIGIDNKSIDCSEK